MRLTALLLCSFFLLACNEEEEPAGTEDTAITDVSGDGTDSGDTDPDAPVDAEEDTAPDAEPDTTPDATPDVEPDVAPDLAPDAESDVAPDAEPDVAPDAEPDVAPDAEPDVAPDAAPDAEPDVAPDATPDAEPDVVPDVVPDTVPRSCEELIAAAESELVRVRSCGANSDCGQVMLGTSCGCSRNMVARLDVDLAWFGDLMEAIGEQSCEYGFISTCDCPPTDGFLCVDGTCQWNYI